MTNAEAKDEILGIVLAALEQASPLYAGRSLIDVRWPNMPQTALEQTNAYWSRVTYTPISSPQRSLARLNGVSRYETTAQLLVQIYSPMTIPDAGNNGEDIASMVQSAFQRQSPSGCIEFQNPNMRTAGNSDTHYIVNVSVTCKYDTYA